MIDRDDFENIPVLSAVGGWGAAKRVFGESKLAKLIEDFNAAVAA